ncbi:hypothetical protein tb265_21990 [Gemmatimonadetes bacterium T265]|nr:hypothetical protein tb265_21990 [Gemmatimonadetes bacterium T265]
MTRVTSARARLPRAAGIVLAATAAFAAACGEDLRTGPEKFHATLETRNWADTLVLGDGRPVGVRVIDDKGREVLDAGVRWQVATPAVLGATALRASAGATPAASATVDARGGDSVQVDTRRPGTTDVVITLTDPRFYTTTVTRRATVVVAGVRAATARDTTVTALGDTATMVGLGLARSGTTLAPRAGSGVVWTRTGPGAVQLGATGDSARAVAQQGGTDTLVVTHPFCLSGARCADTVVVHVAQHGALAANATNYRAWSFGDSVVPTVVLQDARGHAIAGASLQVAPLTATDSAIVSVGAPPASAAPVRAARASLAVAASPVRASRQSALALGATGPASHRASPPAPLRLVVRRDVAAANPVRDAGTTSTSSPAAVALTPLVARGNGTARVAVRAVAGDGSLLAVDTISVVVRQIAAVVHVSPPQSLLTPGDSIPVRMEALDARGYVIADAAFVPAAAGAAVSPAGVVRVAANAGAGTASVRAAVVGPANPGAYADAPIQAPVQDTAWLRVRVPPATVAGDTTGTPLDAPVFSPDGKPVVGAWVRFVVPGGHVSPDSSQTDTVGVAHARWTMPTRAGSYTATAVLLGVDSTAAPAAGVSDSAGRIVLRRTLGVQAGAAAAIAAVTAPPATAATGVVLAPAPAVQIVDAVGNPVRTAGVAVTVALGNGAVGTIAGTLAVATDSAGVARFGDLVLNGAAGVRTLSFSAPSLAPLASGPITVAAGGNNTGQTLVVLSAPTVASGSAVTVTVTPRDAGGNTLGAGHTVVVTVGTGAAGVSTAHVSSVTDVGDGTYVATLTGLRSGTPAPVTATVDGAAATGAPALTVTPGAPVHLTVAPATLSFASIGASGTAAVTSATDSVGNAVPTTALTWSSSAPTVATVTAGAAPSATVTSTGPGGAIVTAHLGAATATVAVSVQQNVAHLTKTAGDNATGTVGSALSATPTVRVEDAQGTPVVGVPVTFSIANGGTLATGSIGGAATQTVTSGAGGLAVAGPWRLGSAPGGYTLGASAGAATPVQFSATAIVGPVDAGQTTVVLSAATVASGGTVTATVTPLDAYGNRVGAGRTVVVRFGSASLPNGVSTGTASAVTDRGDGTYTATLTGTRAGSAVAIGTTVDGITVTAAPTLQITSGGAAHLTLAPTSMLLTSLGATGTVTVASATDGAGNAVPTTGLVWSTSAPAVATVSGGMTSATVTAVANGSVQITATLGSASATAAVTVQQAATQLVAVAGDNVTAPVGTAPSASPAVRAVDAGGHPVPGVSVTFAIATGTGATIGGGATQAVTTAGNGVATAGSWTLGTTPGAYTLTAGAAGLSSLTFHATATGGAVSATQTTLTLSAATVASAGTVTATVTPKDAYGNRLGAGHTVTVVFGSASPPAGISTGTVSTVTDRGDGTYTATLTGVRAGTAAAITATVDGTTVPATAPTLTVTAGAAAQVVVADGNVQTAAVLTAVATPPAVKVTDAAGNPVSAVAVTFAAGAGQGTLAGATQTTNVSGLARVGGWTLGATAGQQTITAAAAGVTGSVSITATATAGAASQIVMGRDSLLLASLAAGDTVTAVVKDANGNVLPTATVTWTTSASATVALGSSGTRSDGTQWVRVTSAANGLARIQAAANSLTGLTKVAVRQAAATISVTGPSAALNIGDTSHVTITARDANGYDVPRAYLKVTSSDTTMLQADTAGHVRGIGPGSPTVTVANAIPNGITGSAVTTVTSTIAYHDFCTLTGLNISGTTRQAGNCVLRLTADSVNQSGGVWQPVKQRLDAGFVTTFRYQMTNGGGIGIGGADGLALVIQSASATATGSNGGGIGYPGLTKALAIELDTWQNSGAPYNDPNGNHVAIQSCGTAALSAYHDSTSTGCTVGWPRTAPINLKDGAVHTVKVVYAVSGSVGTFTAYFDGSTTAAITSTVSLTNIKGASILDANGKAWIGFTAATGGAYQRHDLLSWTFTPTAP